MNRVLLYVYDHDDNVGDCGVLLEHSPVATHCRVLQFNSAMRKANAQ